MPDKSNASNPLAEREDSTEWSAGKMAELNDSVRSTTSTPVTEPDTRGGVSADHHLLGPAAIARRRLHGLRSEEFGNSGRVPSVRRQPRSCKM
jgi:hypothetical protein